MVFSNLSKRLSQVISGDAIANSIVRLDSFALNVSLVMDEILQELKSDMEWQSEGTVISPVKDLDIEMASPSPKSRPVVDNKSHKTRKGIFSTIVTAFKKG